jgi:hypothetical protein
MSDCVATNGQTPLLGIAKAQATPAQLGTEDPILLLKATPALCSGDHPASPQ